MSRSLSAGSVVTLRAAFVALATLLASMPASAQVTTVADYFDERAGAMALNFDTGLYLCEPIHADTGRDPAAAAIRAGETRAGWPNILDDCETFGVPVSFNICGHEALFGDAGPADIAAIDITHSWHPDSYWATNTWYSDAPPSGGDYLTIGDLSGFTRSYGLVYGGDLTERTLNSSVPFEVSFLAFGYESLSDISRPRMVDVISLGVEFHKRIGSKLTADAPPWNNNPAQSRYSVFVQNGIYVFNRWEGATGQPDEVIGNLWAVPRSGTFDVGTDLTSQIDAAIADGHVLAPHSRPEDGFDGANRVAFQNSLAHAQSKVASGELWATTLSEIGRYWEARSDVSTVTNVGLGTTTVQITLTDYDAATFGIPYLTFRSPVPAPLEPEVRISVDYPSNLTLNSASSTVRVDNGDAIYTVYLNPAGVTNVAIESVAVPHTGGVDINEPVLAVVSTPPLGPIEGVPITIQASTTSTDALYTVNVIYQRDTDAKVAATMIDNGGVWEAQIGPFNAGDSVSYYVSATDNGGRRVVTADQNFVVQVGTDVIDPEWRFQSQSESNPVQGTPVQLSAEGRDETALRWARLETDESGSWAERPEYGSPADMGDVADTWVLSSFTWDNAAIAGGTTVSWRIRYQDASGNEVVTDAMSFTVEGLPDPWWQCGWDYRQPITVSETSGTDLTSYPVFAVMDTATLISAGKMRSDCADIRVIDSGTEIASQVVGCDSAVTRVWLQTDLAAFETRPGLYLYYGNPVAVAPDYSGQNSITWDGGTRTMDTGKITGIFDVDGGAIAQVRDNTNNQDLLSGHPQGGVGYLFTDNAAVDYIFRIAESDDSIVLTTDGPIVKVVTSYSGESPQWIQENTFYNDQDFIDFRVYRPAGASTENFLVGVNEIAPDGVFDLTDADELFRAGDSATDTGVVFDEVWRYDPTATRGYAGVVDPTFTNEIALVWDESVTPDFTWLPRTGAVGGIEGTYALFIGGDGTVNSFGTIDADTFDYRFVARYAPSPSNADNQGIHDYYVAAPPAVVLGPEETTAVDTVAPQITITSPINTTYDTDTILLAFTASEEVTTCSYSLDGGAGIPVPDCASTVLTFLDNGPHTVAVDAVDCAGNPGSDLVNFIVDVVPFPWFDVSWGYRVPVTVFTADDARTNEPIEHLVNFTTEWGLLGQTGLTFDPASVRVVEYTPSGSLIGEVPSQFDPAAGYDPDNNAAGTAVWIMDGVTAAQTSRHYYVYFDSTASPKTPPVYVTDLDWDTGTTILSNTGIEATIGTVLDGRTYKTGINSFAYSGTSYTTAAVAEGAGIYHIVRDVAVEGDDIYEIPIDGPVKKTVRITPAAHGSIDFTLYDLAEWIRAEGAVTGTKGLFTSFPYAHALSNTALSNELHYFDSGVVVDETVGTSGFGFLGGAPDEGWACYDGLGGNKGLCLVTDSVTLTASNNFWRYSSSSQQLIFPCWSPNPAFPITPVSWIVMADTFQDGRDFWDRLSAPVVLTLGDPEYNCVATASDDLTCDGVDDDCDGSFDEDYVTMPTTCGVGECAGNAGQLECQGGTPVDTCDPLFGATPEICDTLDNDCDGLTDDADPDVIDQTTWYADADGDTYGDAAAPQTTCVQPAGFVADSTDCNDADENNWASCATCIDDDTDTWFVGCDAYVSINGPDCDDDDQNNWTSCSTCADVDTDTWYVDCDAYVTINGPDCFDDDSANFPGNAEICDGQDNDCDLLDDDADPDVTGQTTWYADVDGDTYGDSAVSQLSCAQPAGFVVDGTDCNDADENNWASCGTCGDLDSDTWYSDCDAYVTFDGPDCADDDPNNWASCASCVDIDTDTWFVGCDAYVTIDGPDCFDDDSANFPGNAEICDGQDNDCDLAVDDADPDVTGGVTWYADSDGDTFGDAAATQSACAQPAGYVADSSDCNDTDENNWASCASCVDVDTDTWYVGCDAYVTINGPDCFDDDGANFPGNAEICDGQDNDCDLAVDDADPDVTGGVTWYADSDGDTFGDAAVSQLACTQPAGFVANSTDCNDADENNWVSCASCVDIDTDTWFVGCDAYVTINGPDCFDDDAANFPGNAEICDGQDNDCDLAVDDADPDVTGDATWYADTDGDTYGDPAVSQVSCPQPPGHVLDGTDCNDTDENNWASCASCVDIDTDTWFVGCDAYVTIDGPDCFDDDSANFPGNAEICDGQDNDCDLAVDDADPDVTGDATWYADTDGDTFGDPAASQTTCSQPAGYVADSSDCDDGSGAVYPGAMEICDGLDNQCAGDVGFGQVDEGGNALCDNLLYCDGAETCGGVSGCLGGAPVVCDDGILCTTGTCNEASDSCDYTTSGSCGVTGSVFYYRDRLTASEPSTKPVVGVSIDLSTGLVSDGTGDAITDFAGGYSFPTQAGTLNVSTLPAFGDPPHNAAVSAFDAAVIAQYSVHLLTLSPHQLLAGDVTNNVEVSAFDAAKVAQFSVGLIDHFEVAFDTGSDWRFLGCTSYPDETSPDCADPMWIHDPLMQPEVDDFYAILYGDVSGDWQTAGGRSVSAESWNFTAEDQPLALRGVSLRPLPRAAEVRDVRRDPAMAPAVLTQTVRRGAEPGQFEVLLGLDNADGILGLDLDIAYDPTHVTVVSARTLELASQFSVASNEGQGHLRLGMFSPAAMTGSGSILSIEIESTGEGREPSIRVAGQANEGEIPLHGKPGDPLELMPAQTSYEDDRNGAEPGTDGPGDALVSFPASLTVPPGGDVVVPIHLDPADGALSLDLEFTYDSSVLRASGAYTTALTDDFLLFPNLATDGVVRIALFDTVALVGSGDVVWVVFTAVGPAGSGTDLVWSNASLNEGAIPSTTANGRVDLVAADTTVSLPDCASGLPASTVWVPIVADPADGFEGVNLTLQYNPSVIEAVDARTTVLSAGCSEFHNIDVTVGTVEIALVCTAPLSGSGAIVEVAFDVVGSTGSEAPICLHQARVNEGGITSATDAGLFVIGTDADSDGFTASCGDCDDAEESVYPGAPEICDGLDNQCPGDAGFGAIDEGHDDDGDGVANCIDPDDDNDGVLDGDDCAPSVNSVSDTPEAIGSLVFGPGTLRLEWLNTANANVFNIYRGSISGVAGFAYNHTCLEQEVADTEYTDPAIPQPGEALYYLVSGRNSCPAGEGSLGLDSLSADRPNGSPCPTAGTADTDTDLVPDIDDNCPLDPNPGQEDGDGDGVGDLCDNCPSDPDSTQLDSDGDGTGDVCQ